MLESRYAYKFSRHLLVYASGMTSTDSKRIARALAARTHALSTDDTDRALTVWKKETKGIFQLKSVFDIGVYTPYRAMRMAYCVKRGKDNPLRPVLDSSDDTNAHLVNVVPPEEFTPPHLVPPLNLSRLPVSADRVDGANEKKGSCLGFVVTGSSGGVADGMPMPTPRWQPGQLVQLRADVLGSAALLRLLKVDGLVIRSENISPDGGSISFYVKNMRSTGEVYPTCPYSKCVHQSNNMALVYNHKFRSVTVQCFDADCATKPRARIYIMPVVFPEDTATALAAVVGGPSLHTCEDLVHYAPVDKYNEDRMRPYPDHPLLVVMGNMGIGEWRGS